MTIALSGDELGVHVVVTDEGPGIDPDMLPRLFEFGATSKGDLGNGMGLWTVKHIVNKHGGNVAIESSRNDGTSVKLWWPKRYSGLSNGEAVRR